MIFDAYDHAQLSTLFEPDYAYPGYKPNVLEAPNGDGKIDAQKRYLHVALKYNPPAWALLYLARAHFEACRVAEAMGVPADFYPRVEDGTLRVLDYPAGAGSEQHTDFDLFTVHCYRNAWEPFVRPNTLRACSLDCVSEGLHIGEIGALVGLGPATPHLVKPSDAPQEAIVYFAMPAMAARLSDGSTVRGWLADRYARSRVYK